MKPQSLSTEIILTAMTPISHHDPAIQSGSNILTFNRQKQMVAHPEITAQIGQATIDRFCAGNPVPSTLAGIVRDIPFTEFIAITLVRLLIDMYNSQDGVGLFSGMARYDMLESRARIAAIKSSNLRSFWSNLTRDLQLPMHFGKQDDALTSYFALPTAIQFAVINQVAKEYRSIITVARVWHAQAKLQNDSYAEKAQLPLDVTEPLTMKFNTTSIQTNPSLVLDIPAISANSLRHQMVREPGWLHLFGALDLEGQVLPVEAEAIFYNGGNIRAGAKQPLNAYNLAYKVRHAYPLLDLLGGVCDSFDLGESLLSVSTWLVCRENRAALGSVADLPETSVSAFDLLDDITHTRQATGQGVGQMIYNFETLMPGTKILVRLALKPYARRLAIGALAASIQTYLDCHPVIAGQSARGFGMVNAEILDIPVEYESAGDEYEAYLIQNHDQLRDWIVDGTLGSGVRVVS